MVLIFDMGATKARMALVNDGLIGDIVRIDTDRSAAGFAKFLGVLQELAGGHKLRAVVGGFPGQLGGEEGRVVWASNLPEWLGLPLLEKLKAMFDCPVHVTNDVILTGLGEAHAGSGSAEGTMVYFTVSTGVNAVRLVNGRVDTSIPRFEIGHQLIRQDKDGWKSLEWYTGGAKLQQRFGREPKKLASSKVWEHEVRYLAAGLYNTVLHWAPEVVVFGGSMMTDIDLDELAAELMKLPAVLPAWPRLVKAKLGDRSGLEGAVVYLKQLG